MVRFTTSPLERKGVREQVAENQVSGRQPRRAAF
jgi:hypothetical protein